MKYALHVCLGVIILSVLLAGAQMIVIFLNVAKGAYNVTPYARHEPHARLKFLFLGDSTAVGIGAVQDAESVAGRFGQDFPDADIENNSYNGRRLNQLIAEFPDNSGPYDLVVMQIGANDILKFTPYKTIDREITQVIAKAKAIGHHVVILHSGNVGLAPVFIWPFNWIMTERSRQVRQIYIREARQQDVIYVDLFTERGDDLFLKDIPKYYSPDRLHPSGSGYGWWYRLIRAAMQSAGVEL